MNSAPSTLLMCASARAGYKAGWVAMWVAMWAAGAALSAGCSDDPQLIADLEDHADPLSSGPGDNLFVLELFEAERAYPVDGLTVEVNPYGGSAVSVEFDLAGDQDGDGALGVGDQLVGREGPVDTYNEGHSGTLFEVRVLFTDGSGTTRELLFKQWVGDGGLG